MRSSVCPFHSSSVLDLLAVICVGSCAAWIRSGSMSKFCWQDRLSHLRDRSQFLLKCYEFIPPIPGPATGHAPESVTSTSQAHKLVPLDPPIPSLYISLSSKLSFSHMAIYSKKHVRLTALLTRTWTSQVVPGSVPRSAISALLSRIPVKELQQSGRPHHIHVCFVNMRRS